ncbi:hypothetical protein CEUSTIGMA_g9762.t1 [Chlamydomonas eustigma]|uniref:Mini-chromosome maintenance complex-binding protein n=1 Tax=Chlamydomonas eustigma TaxID=1157962 RepID=A0A250XH11_9CHLO|nr:hypothetical protein CEUSTIGMA_g9762.t1 [Chlamydomonas eustigma]|eukprot:GAX82333.1 hypothetical protein CEUSTIGMA_g9762.t1 [Chlamydomonas eustigma]
MSNIVLNPLDCISTLFKASRCSSKETNFGVSDYFDAEIKNSSTEIPTLTNANVGSLPNLSLVRLVGTVQDLPNPELYLGVAKLPDGSLITTKYSDGIDPRLAQCEQVSLWDRRPVVLTAPPCSSWVSGFRAASRESSSASLGHNLASQHEGFLAYLYDDQGTNVCLHDLVEILGILSKQDVSEELRHKLQEQHLGDTLIEGDQDQIDGFVDDAQAFSKMIRVHAISITRKPNLRSTLGTIPPACPASDIIQLRSDAVSMLSSGLGGDALAAEYLLMLSLESVTTRVSEGMTTGIAPLNITNCPASPHQHTNQDLDSGVSEFAAALHYVLSELLPLSASLPLNVAACNKGDWSPCRPPGQSRVQPSPLQLPHGTCLIVDETGLTQGRLDEKGTSSLAALQRVLTEQILVYEFEMFKHPVPVNLPTVVLSTCRSILKEALPVTLPLAPSKNLASLNEVKALLSEQLGQLEVVRGYLAAVSSLPYEITEGAKQRLVEEFVIMRQKDASFGPEQFQNLLTLARACALSFGESSLTGERWEYLKGLEVLRSSRQLTSV